MLIHYLAETYSIQQDWVQPCFVQECENNFSSNKANDQNEEWWTLVLLLLSQVKAGSSTKKNKTCNKTLHDIFSCRGLNKWNTW